MKSIIKWFFKLTFVIIFIVIIWLVCALILSKITLSDNTEISEKPISIYVLTNGVHTDIVLPRINSYYNWNNFISENSSNSIDTSFKHLAIGWGDKAFYLETPTWNDLKTSTAFKAAFGLGETAMHVRYYKHININQNTKQINLSISNYLKLTHAIKQSFKMDSLNNPKLIQHPNYGINDNYYEAQGSYSCFKTCNVWTGNTLKIANVKMGIWTPLSAGVINNL